MSSERALEALDLEVVKQLRRWHHASQLQADIADHMGYFSHFSKAKGWEVFCTDADFGRVVIEAGGRGIEL